MGWLLEEFNQILGWSLDRLTVPLLCMLIGFVASQVWRLLKGAVWQDPACHYRGKYRLYYYSTAATGEIISGTCTLCRAWTGRCKAEIEFEKGGACLRYSGRAKLRDGALYIDLSGKQAPEDLRVMLAEPMPDRVIRCSMAILTGRAAGNGQNRPVATRMLVSDRDLAPTLVEKHLWEFWDDDLPEYEWHRMLAVDPEPPIYTMEQCAGPWKWTDSWGSCYLHLDPNGSFTAKALSRTIRGAEGAREWKGTWFVWNRGFYLAQTHYRDNRGGGEYEEVWLQDKIKDISDSAIHFVDGTEFTRCTEATTSEETADPEVEQ